MKKTTVFILCFVLLLSSILLCGCKKEETKEEGREKLLSAAFELSGDPNVPKKDEGTYEERLGTHIVRSTFDSNGRLTEKTYISLATGAERVFAYRYYESGKVMSVTERRDAETLGTGTSYEYSYGDGGKMTGREQYTLSGCETFPSISERCEYDEEGKISRIYYTYGDSGEPAYYDEFDYDEKSRIITVTGRTIGSDGTRHTYKKYYDVDWDLVREERRNNFDELECRIEYQKSGQQKHAWYYPTVYSGRADAYEEDENGRTVKSVTALKTTIIEYGENGKRKRETYYDPEGNVQSFKAFEWNDKGRKTAEREYRPDGYLLKETFYASGGVVESVIVYGYNDAGKRISQKKYNGEGILRYVLEFNGSGGESIYTITREETYDLSGTLEKYSVYEYNEKGFRISDTEFAADGTIRNKNEYQGESHDDLGKPTKSIIYSDGKAILTFAYEYSEKGFRKLEKTYDENGVLRIVTEYTGETDIYWHEKTREDYYDESGNPDGYVVYERSESEDIAKEYDKNGTLLFLYEYHSGALFRTTEYNPDGTVKSVETY